MNLLLIRDLVRQINTREQNVAQLEAAALAGVGNYVSEVVLQGKDLIVLKTELKHGAWMALFNDGKVRLDHRVTYKRAQRYMRVAMNVRHIPELQHAGSLRQALALCEQNDATQHSTDARRLPAPLDAVHRAAKLVAFIDRNPIDTWPEPTVIDMRKKIEPIARKLWPQNFLD